MSGRIESSNFNFQPIQWQTAQPAAPQKQRAEVQESPEVQATPEIQVQQPVQGRGRVYGGASRTEAPREAAPVEPSLPEANSGPMERIPVREIQAIAEKVGFVGVTERDIRRAYMLGESLLTDYRV